MRNRFVTVVTAVGLLIAANPAEPSGPVSQTGPVSTTPKAEVEVRDRAAVDAALDGYEASWEMWVTTMSDPASNHQEYVYRHLTGEHGASHLFILGFLASQNQRLDGTYEPNARVESITGTEAEVFDCGTESFTHLDATTGEVLETTTKASVAYRATMVLSKGNWRRRALMVDPEGCAPR